jgi:hypothetical protein
MPNPAWSALRERQCAHILAVNQARAQQVEPVEAVLS